jgi:hypothetical protein
VTATQRSNSYATGMLLLSPLGDLIRRRPFLLIIEGCATLLSIGLATTNNVHAFMALSFLVAVCTITPQILLTYAADLAPPHRRAEAIATVLRSVFARKLELLTEMRAVVSVRPGPFSAVAANLPQCLASHAPESSPA